MFTLTGKLLRFTFLVCLRVCFQLVGWLVSSLSFFLSRFLFPLDQVSYLNTDDALHKWGLLFLNLRVYCSTSETFTDQQVVSTDHMQHNQCAPKFILSLTCSSKLNGQTPNWYSTACARTKITEQYSPLTLNKSGCSWYTSKYSLTGLVVRHPSPEQQTWVQFLILPRIFSKSSHTSDLKISTPVTTLPGTWQHRVSAGTVWPGVSILWLDGIESLICNFYPSVESLIGNFYLSVAACTTVRADPSPRYNSMLLGCYTTNKQHLYLSNLPLSLPWVSNSALPRATFWPHPGILLS